MRVKRIRICGFRCKPELIKFTVLDLDSVVQVFPIMVFAESNFIFA
jgi:hypothetical protein